MVRLTSSFSPLFTRIFSFLRLNSVNLPAVQVAAHAPHAMHRENEGSPSRTYFDTSLSFRSKSICRPFCIVNPKFFTTFIRYSGIQQSLLQQPWHQISYQLYSLEQCMCRHKISHLYYSGCLHSVHRGS